MLKYLFITSDENLRYQKSLVGRHIAILELSTNDISRFQKASALIEDALEKIQLHEFRQSTIREEQKVSTFRIPIASRLEPCV